MAYLARTLSLSLCVALLTGGLAFAEESDATSRILQRLEALERENDALKRRVEELERGQTGEQVLPPVSAVSEHQLPAVEPTQEGHGLGLYAEFLYWNVTEDVPYVVVDNNNSNVFDGTLRTAGWDWDPGFRVGARYLLPDHDGWEVGARYTYLRGGGYGETTVGEGQTLFATRINPNVAPGGAIDEYFRFAEADLDLDFDQLETEIGRRFWISRTLSTRLFGGPHFAWIDRDYLFRYCEIETGSCGGPFTTVGEGLELDAYGLRVGIDGDWHIGRGLSLYGSISGSALYGMFDWRIREVDPVGPSGRLNVDIEESFNRFVPVLQVGAGLAYSRPLGERMALRAQVGWEAQSFFNMAGRQFVGESPTAGINTTEATDLTLHGLTARLLFDF